MAPASLADFATEILLPILWFVVNDPDHVNKTRAVCEMQRVCKRFYHLFALPEFRSSYGLTTQSAVNVSSQVVQAIAWFESASSQLHPLQLSLSLVEPYPLDDTYAETRPEDVASFRRLLNLYAGRWNHLYLECEGLGVHCGGVSFISLV